MIAVAALLPAAPASGWTPPQPIFGGAARDVFAVSGDPAGNAFALVLGDTLDRPLSLIERSGAGDNPFTWKGARPLPGGERYFTTGLDHLDSFQSAAAGDGSGLIAWRAPLGGGATTLTVLLREPPQPFALPITIAGADLSPRAGVSVAINASSTALVAFRIGRGSRSSRVTAATRIAPRSFGRPRVLSASPSGSPVTAVGGDGASVVAWIRSRRVEARRFDASGLLRPVERLGRARFNEGISAALGKSGAGLIAWQDSKAAIRAVRRGAPGTFAGARLVRAVRSGARVDGLSTAVDDRDRVYVAWRETRSSSRRVLVAAAPKGGPFTFTQLASGSGLGAPSLAARPGGGAAVAWRAPTAWQARVAPASGVFTAVNPVSRALAGIDSSFARAALIAGPDIRVDLFWPQRAVDDAQTQIYQSSDETAPPVPGG